MYAKYRNTPVASPQLAQSVAGLLTTHRLTPDVRCAAYLAPFRFHTDRDRVFYTNRYWCDAGPENEIAASKVVLNKFNSWYPKTGPMEQAHLAVAALIDSYDHFENIIDDALLELHHDYRVEMIDSDDAMFYTHDFHAVRDPANIRSALDTERVAYWIEIFREQIRRVVDAPPVRYEAYRKWDEEFTEQYEAVRNQFQNCIYTHSGFTVRQGRRIVIRSWRLLVSMIGVERARDFVAGREIYLRGPKFIWGLKMHSNNLIKYTLQPPGGHCPYRMTLYDEQMEKLAECCVVFADLPVLDQAVGIVLGLCNYQEEVNLLRDCNLSQYTKAGKVCELLRPYDKDREWEDLDPFDIETRSLGPSWNGGRLLSRAQELPAPQITCDPSLDDDSDGTEGQTPRLYDSEWDWGVSEPEDYPIDLPIASPVLAQRRHHIRVRFGALVQWRREQRRLNPVCQLLQEHLFDRIGGPREILAYMADPDFHPAWYGPRSRRLPERVISFITEKEI